MSRLRDAASDLAGSGSLSRASVLTPTQGARRTMTHPGLDGAAMQQMIDDLVVRASEDWVMLTEVDWIVKNHLSRHDADVSVESRVDVGLDILSRVFQCGLMRAGTVSDQPPGFEPWDGAWPEVISRIERGWRERVGSLQMGDVCWLANTASGDSRAEAVRTEVNERARWA